MKKPVIISGVVIIAIILVLAFVMLGNGGKSSGEGKEVIYSEPKTAPADLKQNIVQKSNSIDSFKLDIKQDMNMRFNFNNELTETIVKTDVTGYVDKKNQKISFEGTVYSKDSDDNKEETHNIKTIIKDGKTYSKEDNGNYEIVSEDLWEDFEKYDSLVYFTESSEIKIIGEERISGYDCYIIEIEPDISDLFKNYASADSEVNLDNFNMKDLVDNFSLKMWVDKDSQFIIQDEMSMTIDKDMGEFGSMYMNMYFKNTRSEINKPVSDSIFATN